ncbi:class I mannose-6-phosphate isomerase [Geminisphaera colitermitum]|uniref:class I mannose-6-phosphate isomerase n=1 Tax=Geminisphaera colitermitum TaxID=1148786 RepID=UPI000158CD7B|nr:class I mannose-6-phosphate isomerase [Geminisphaera colitermitum]
MLAQYDPLQRDNHHRPMRQPILSLLPNRVRRNYGGGSALARWTEGASEPDSNRPEDWLASTTPAINRGMDDIPHEGIGRVADSSGKIHTITDLFAAHGDYYLGAKHLARLGPNLGFLAKILDSSMRLHTQAHPTREFAQKHLNSPYGKLECYVILAARPGYPADLRLGFQHAPTRDEWREIIETQNIARMDACFEHLPARPGEVWLVPGGMVHALGAGLLLLEVMEPSDLVVRCEFEREGIVVPPDARFMGRGLDFCLDIFDYTEMSPAAVRARCQMQPTVLRDTPAVREECHIPLAKTNCFEVRRLSVRERFVLESEGVCRLVVVSQGACRITTRDRSIDIVQKPGARFLLAANGDPVTIEPATADAATTTPLELWCCQP